MNASFYSHLASSNLLLRNHLRLGTETLPGGDKSLAQTNTIVGVSSAFAVLDAFLPWRGWPVGAMTEIMTDIVGCGELSLLLPAMAHWSRKKRPILCLGAPNALFAPALARVGVDPAFVTQINASPSTQVSKNTKENLWTAEQALKTGLPGMVVMWSHPRSNLAVETLRRLHLSTIGRETMLIHFRGASCMSQPSPAWLRFGYVADDTHIRLQVLKCRGRELTRPLITLDRAAVQTRLYGQVKAVEKLERAITGNSSNAVSQSAIAIAGTVNSRYYPTKNHPSGALRALDHHPATTTKPFSISH